MGRLNDAVAEVRADLIAALPGIGTAPHLPPDEVDAEAGPQLLVYAGNALHVPGTADNGNGRATRWCYLTINVEVYVARDSLAHAIDLAMGFSDAIPDALFGGYNRDRFAGTVVALGNEQSPGGIPIRAPFGPADWGTDLIRYRHELDVSLQEEVTP